MAGGEMTAGRAGWVCAAAVAAALAVAVDGGRVAAAPTTNLETNSLPAGTAPPAENGPATLTPGTVLPAATDRAVPRDRELRGNPLWGIPLKLLTATRERPIFSPSRRAPAPVVAGPPPVQAVASPPPPPPPERPRLTLIGAIAGADGGIAVILDEATRDIIRLRTGENHAGWVLRSVCGREATLEKDRETMLLALPAPVDQPKPPGEQQL
jgi:general secretion pathway protein N